MICQKLHCEKLASTHELMFLFQIIDAYMMFAYSAIAGNTIPRSLFGAAFPMFGESSLRGRSHRAVT